MANVKATDLIDFTRASKGHALAKISYGDNELPSASFEVIGTGTWDNTEFIDTVGSQVRPGVTSQTSLTDGTTYALFINITEITGATQVRVDGLDGTDRLLGEGDHRISFISNGGTPRVRLEDTSTSVNDGFNLQSALTANEVTFNQTDGTLQLFEHPNNIPRIEYDADGNLLGLLIEEARTNLITKSNSASALSTGSAISATDSTEVTSPTGSGTVIKLNKTASGYGYSRFSYSSTTDTQTFSAFVKKGTARYVGLRTLASGGTHTTFDLDTGTFVVTTGSADRTAVEVGNGWYRLSITNSAASSWASVAITDATGSELNDETGTAYVFGFQRELGSFPTSYIETTGSTASRSADVASIDVDQFGYNQSEGTVVSEYTPTKVNGDVKAVFEISSDSTDDRAYHSASTGNHWVIRSGGSLQANIDAGTTTANQANKVAGVYKVNDFAVTIDGGTVATDTNGSVPVSIGKLFIGKLFNGYELNGHIKSITYTPKRLSNAKLQELTS